MNRINRERKESTMSKKIISVLLALTLALGCCSALAENTKH